jgi:pilus assembly protein CpaF
MVDARLPDGSRIHVVVPPAAVDHPVVAIRRFTQAIESLDELEQSGTATPAQIDELRQAVARRRTILVSGGTGAGKTTLLNLLAGLIPAGERVVTIEDAAELRIPGHRVRLEAHPANAEGVGEITIRQLLRSALRLRPDRIIVGEVRGKEAMDLIWALNTGHRGSLSTVHANSAQEALWRIETLALSAGDTAELAVRRQLLAAVDLVVQMQRSGPTRQISAIAAVGPSGIEGGS